MQQLQKLNEISFLRDYSIQVGNSDLKQKYEENQSSIKRREQSTLIHKNAVKTRLVAVKPEDFNRKIGRAHV